MYYICTLVCLGYNVFYMHRKDKSDATVTPRSRHEVTWGRTAPLSETPTMGSTLPTDSTQHLYTETDNCQRSAHLQRAFKAAWRVNQSTLFTIFKYSLTSSATIANYYRFSLLYIQNCQLETGYVQKFIINYCQLANAGYSITLVWIPGHTGIRELWSPHPLISFQNPELTKHYRDVPSVLWYCWLGLLTCKNRLPYNLYCVGGDVKHCSIQSKALSWCLAGWMGWMLC